MAKQLTVDGVTFQAERVDFYCELRRHASNSPIDGYAWKSGWRLLLDGVVIWDGKPASVRMETQRPEFKTFAALSSAVKKAQQNRTTRYIFWKTVEHATGQDHSDKYQSLT